MKTLRDPQVQIWLALIGMVGSVALGLVNRLWPEETQASAEAVTRAASAEAKAQEADGEAHQALEALIGSYAATKGAVDTLIERVDRLEDRAFRLEGLLLEAEEDAPVRGPPRSPRARPIHEVRVHGAGAGVAAPSTPPQRQAPLPSIRQFLQPSAVE